jgi:protein ImuB
VRWQLEAWLTARASDGGRDVDDGGDDVVTGGLTTLALAPDAVVPATGRQLGFWGGDAAAGDRAARVLARVQGMLGPETVVTAVLAGGRTPAERFRWVPWGEPRDTIGPVDAPWPGTVPGPAPARIFDPPVPAELLDGDGRPISVSGRGEQSSPLAMLWCDALPGGGGAVAEWSGPWLYDLRWWDRLAALPRGHRGARWQVVIDGGDGTGVACLVTMTRGRAGVEAIYD